MSRIERTSGWSRREFLGKSAALAAGVCAMPAIIPASAWGADGVAAPSERITLGAIGMGGRGRDDLQVFMAQPDVQVLAVCDVHGENREKVKTMVNQKYGNEDCAAYIDFRELLARDDIDAVLIATGDNNHSLVSVMAARAGKDMYCEKPMSVTIGDSRAVADTMKRLGRIFQCGTQRRSVGNFVYACELARSGKLGKLKELHAEQAGGMFEFNYEILPEEPEPAREVFDWSGWLGGAQWRPYNAKTPTRGFWSNHIDFSGAAITEWGSHTVDLCQWANNTDHSGPVEFWREDTRYIGRYADGTKLVIRNGLRFGSCPVRFEGEEGWVETGDSGEIETFPKSLMPRANFPGGYPVDNHVRAFLDCVKTRTEPISNAETAHRSISACHVANMVKRLNRPVRWDPVTETCIDDEEANRMRSRAYREPWYL